MSELTRSLRLPPPAGHPDSAQAMMRDVLVALTPALAMAVFFFGPRALLLTAVSVVSCVLFEGAYRRFTHQSDTRRDLSACVTGLLLVVLVVIFVGHLAGNMRRSGDIPYSQMRALFTEEKVQSFAIENERLTASLRDGTTATCELYSFDAFYEDLNDLVVAQREAGIIEAYDSHADHSPN